MQSSAEDLIQRIYTTADQKQYSAFIDCLKQVLEIDELQSLEEYSKLVLAIDTGAKRIDKLLSPSYFRALCHLEVRCNRWQSAEIISFPAASNGFGHATRVPVAHMGRRVSSRLCGD